jgi:hypothetical protein
VEYIEQAVTVSIQATVLLARGLSVRLKIPHRKKKTAYYEMLEKVSVHLDQMRGYQLFKNDFTPWGFITLRKINRRGLDSSKGKSVWV